MQKLQSVNFCRLNLWKVPSTANSKNYMCKNWHWGILLRSTMCHDFILYQKIIEEKAGYIYLWDFSFFLTVLKPPFPSKWDEPKLTRTWTSFLLDTLRSQPPMCVCLLITSSLLFLTFFRTFLPRLAASLIAMTALEGHLFADPSMPGRCPTLVMCLFPTCCLLVCGPVIIFSSAAFIERMYTEGVDTRANMYFQCDDTDLKHTYSILFAWGRYSQSYKMMWMENSEHSAWALCYDSSERPACTQ